VAVVFSENELKENPRNKDATILSYQKTKKNGDIANRICQHGQGIEEESFMGHSTDVNNNKVQHQKLSIKNCNSIRLQCNLILHLPYTTQAESICNVAWWCND